MYKLKKLEELGKKIRNERRKLDLSQSDVSLQTGLSISYISLLESGKYLPSWKKNDWREKLCIILNLEENDFFLTIDEIREEKIINKKVKE